MNINFKKSLALLLAAVMVLLLPACVGQMPPSDDSQEQDTTIEETPSSEETKMPDDTQKIEDTQPTDTQPTDTQPTDTQPTDTQPTDTPSVTPPTIDSVLWTDVPLTSQAQADAGIAGGEGCQWPLFITFSELDGNLAFMGIDVGGLYRSTDGGKSWKHSSVGLGSEGATSIKVDPNNGDRFLLCGVNSGANAHNGLYISNDAGITWTPVCTNGQVVGHRDYRDSIAFDKSSNSASVGGSTIAYWLTDWGDLYKTTDGCKTWSKIASSSDYTDGEIFVHPSNNYVYIASKKGFFRSTNQGESFEKRLNASLTGIDVIDSRPDNIYLSSTNGLYVSTDAGNSFENLRGSGYPECAYRIEVSPAEPDYMALCDDKLKVKNQYSNKIYYSHDGGKTWTASSRDTSDSIIPFNARSQVISWHPTDKNVCISTGGDMAMRSTDGGRSFRWSNSGFSGAACTGLSINVNNPNLMYASNQDYNGFYSTDGGETWNYVQWYADWGGFTYGGYVVDEDHVIAISKVNNNYYICYTTNGGKTIENTNIAVDKNFRAVTGVPGDENIVLCNAYRSTDCGITWKKMDGCVAVFDSNPENGHLYGLDTAGRPVVSTDKGETWSRIGTYARGVKDMEYDVQSNRLIILSNNVLYGLNCEDGSVTTIKSFSSMKDGYGDEISLRCVEVDPENSNRIYVGNARHVNASDVGVLMTEDGGKTWVNLTSTRDNIFLGDDGGREVNYLVLCHETRTLYAIGMCRGIYKMSLPTE